MDKKNTELCKSCKYHDYIGHNGDQEEVYCAYSKIKHTTCRKRDGTDIRGNDPEVCLIYEEGEKIRQKCQNPAWRTWRTWKGQ